MKPKPKYAKSSPPMLVNRGNCWELSQMGKPLSADCPVFSSVKRETPSLPNQQWSMSEQHSGRNAKEKMWSGAPEVFPYTQYKETRLHHQPLKGHSLGQGMPNKPGGLAGTLTMN